MAKKTSTTVKRRVQAPTNPKQRVIKRRTAEKSSLTRCRDHTKKIVMMEMQKVGYDGVKFCDWVEQTAFDRKKKGQSQRKIRWLCYCTWAHALFKKEVGPPNCQYTLPPEVLSFVRAVLPRDIKGEIWPIDENNLRYSQTAAAWGSAIAPSCDKT